MSNTEAETSPEPRKAAATAKRHGSGSALTDFLSIMDGYEAARAEASAEVQRLTAELAEATAKLAKVEAYKAIHDGKMPAASGEPAAKQRRASGPRAARGETPGKVMEVIREAKADGVNRAEVIQALGIRGDKSGEASVSNALATLKKAGTIVHNSDGRYSLPV